ncbi:MAG: PAS domain S-box protein [bacterium]|nr:PAS domain S-box protein [bacterium]
MKTIHVLYIEDDTAQRTSLAERLEERGMKVSTAGSGAAGVEGFVKTVHDVVLCDLNMPGLGGLEVLGRLRQCCKETPFILLTAHGSVSEAVAAIKQGAQHFSLKPVDVDELEINIRHAVEHVSLRSKLRESHRDFRRLIRNVPDVVFSINSSGEITDINPSGEAATGYGREEMIGQPISRVIHADDIDILQQGLDESPGRGEDDVRTVQVRVVTRDGRERKFEVNRRLVFDKGGKHVRTDGIGRDITERVKLEKELEVYRRDLETKVEERTEELGLVNRQLEALNEVSQLLSGFSDEATLIQAVPLLLTKSLDFDRAGFLIVGDNGLELAAHEFTGLSEELERGLLDGVSSGRIGMPVHFTRCLEQDETIFVADIKKDPDWPQDIVEHLEADAAVLTPVRVQNRPIGILVANMQFHTRQLDNLDIARFETFAAMVGLTIDNMRSYQNLESKVVERTRSLRDANDELLSKARELEEKHSQLQQLHGRLSRHRDELQAILDSSADPVLMVNRENVITIASRASSKWFGGRLEEVIGGSFEDFVATIDGMFEDPALFRVRLEEAARESEAWSYGEVDPRKLFEKAVIFAGPPKRTLFVGSLAVTSAEGEELGRVWFFGDITALMRADEQLRTIVNASPIPLIVSRLEDGLIIYTNEHLGRLVGYSTDDLLNRTTPDFYYDKEDRRRLLKILKRDGAVHGFETRILRNNGSFIWCLMSLVVTTLQGEPVIIGGLYDISERREADEALAFSEKRFRGLVENSRGVIASIDPQGHFTYLSPSFKSILGYEPRDFIGRSMLDLLPDHVAEAAREYIEAGFPSTTEFQSADYQMMHKDGHLVWVSSSGTVIRDDKGEAREVIWLANDITHIKEVNEELARANKHLKDTQSQLVQSEKMASLGLLVAGIAHEINTPIGAVNSMHNTQHRAYLKLKEAISSECGRACEDNDKIAPLTTIMDDANRVIETGVERVTTIVRRLRSFARLDEAELKTVDIHEGLEDTLTLIHHEIKNRIKVVRDYGDLPPLACFPGRLNQVFLNLLNNARQAIAGEGKITITTAIRDVRAVIKFADDGVGIAPEKLKRIFDPGFTTKGVGVGTGLGLSICYQIIEDHRGRIDATSTVGKGTTLTISLPMNLGQLVDNNA